MPWLGGCEYRDRALDWALGRYAARHPDWGVTIAPGGRPWVTAAAVNPAVERSAADIVVVADADVWCDGLLEAVYAVIGGEPWAIPHGDVHRLSPEATTQLLAGADPRRLELAEAVWPGVQGGGYVIARRETLLDIPLDPRFVGWGQEDTSWAMALHYLAGPAWRIHRPLYHLWHPPQDRMSRKRGSVAGWQLYRRYCTAREHPARMRELVEEGKRVASEPPAEPPVHDHAA